MCHRLCKLLGPELSYVATDVKLQTSQVATAANSIIGLLFAADENTARNDEKRQEATKDLLYSLVQLYGELKKKSDEEAVSFEVVMISMHLGTGCGNSSSSNTSSSVRHTFSRKDLPFLYISSEKASKIQEYLARKYKIQETPSLLLLQASSAEVILYDAKEKLLEDPKGVLFPWKYPSLHELFSSVSLLRNSFPTAASDSKEGKHNDNECSDLKQMAFQTKTVQITCSSIHAPVKALLFSAFWCPPCRTFLTTLTELYREINQNEKRLEIIFVSSDRSQESFNRFFASMPWTAVCYEDEKLRATLTKKFNVKAIPSVILLDHNNQIITTEGRLQIHEDLEGIEFPWYPRSVEELRDRHSDVVNNSLCIIYFTDNTENDYEKGEFVLTPIATEIENSQVPEMFETKFFVAADSDLAESLRIFMDLNETFTYIVIMDVSNLRYAVQEVGKNNENSTASAK